MNYTSFMHSVNSAVASVSEALVPQSIINVFFSETQPVIIVFVGSVMLVMYVVLVYALLKICSMCFGYLSGSKPARKHNYRVVDGFSTSSATGVDAERSNVVL
jgi:hypothetical protein